MKHYHEFRIGQFRGYIFTDGLIHNTASNLFANAPDAALHEMLLAHHLDADAIPICFNMVLIDTGSHKILIDTGVGHDPSNATHGFLYENLGAIDVDFKEVDFVFISHAHADHIACNTDTDGNPLFPNARYLIWQEEWDYWTHPETLQVCNLHTNAVRRNLLGIQERFERLNYEGCIVQGVSVVTAFGHTPGHLAVHVKSEGEHFLYAADAFHHPLHIAYPEWVYHSDVDYQEARQSRLKLLNLAANTNALFSTYHMAFPALGRIERRGNRFQWVLANNAV